MYAVCQEKDQYGDLQNYICDLDNKVQLDVAAVSSYTDSGEPDPDETALKIVKLEEGTEIPLEGAVFSVYDPEGKKVGSFSTGPDGTVTIPLTLEGHYTVYNKTATLTFLERTLRLPAGGEAERHRRRPLRRHHPDQAY